MNKDLELRAQKLSKEAVLKNGTQFQIDRCIEEMSELTKALLKDRRDSSYDTMEDILYEFADVLFTLTHIQVIYEFTDAVIDEAFNKSLERFKREERL